MIHLETGLKIGVVYWVKYRSNNSRLRVKINNRAYYCGKTIKDTRLFIEYICGDGCIILRSFDGQKYEIKTKVFKNNTDK